MFTEVEIIQLCRSFLNDEQKPEIELEKIQFEVEPYELKKTKSGAEGKA